MTKKVLSFDIDQTLNIAKTPITDDIAELLIRCSDYYEICPISGQKFDQFLIQIVNPMLDNGVKPAQLTHLHLFVAQGTQYYIYENKSDKYDEKNWKQVYNYPLTDEQVKKISETIEKSARELGYWEEDKLQPGDEIIENRLSQVTFSALGQKAGTEEKYAWDPDCKKREKIVARCKELAPEFDYEIGGTTSINAITPGMNKEFGMTHLLEELKVTKDEILYFGDMTQPGGNDYPVVQMGIDTITVRNHEDTGYALRGILGVSE
ncbi:HAD-IIB family hydrolase [Candidatus Saccharibacteria bacterium]|nr:HAD-IIB family hydrolase [Candidatus Saccharibacteria bacterium]MBR2863985.1 HAD-IIB family hydrolase [Candidatus Saccharibacteria bacterium]